MTAYIYESPDGGNTIYRRKRGEPFSHRTLVRSDSKTDKIQLQRDIREIIEMAEEDPILKDMIDKLLEYYYLKK